LQSRTGIGEKEQIHVIGVPLEDTTSFRQGTRYAPTVIRQLSPLTEATTSKMRNIDNSNIRDIGDIALIHGDIRENVERIRRSIRELVSLGLKKMLIIGGEHTITYASCTGINDNILLVVFDAHLDMRDEWPLGQRLSHATHLRRLLEEKENLYMLHIGARAFDNEEIVFARNMKERLVMLDINVLRDLNRGTLSRIIRDFLSTTPKIDTLYISVDLDVLDISTMPAVSNPEGYGGLSFDELLKLLEMISCLQVHEARCKICDVVEYCPTADPSLTYCTVVIKLILDLMGLYLI